MQNLGIEIARGNWIAFLDSDDIWFPERLEKIYQLISIKKNLDVITTNEYKVFDSSKRRKKLFYGISRNNQYKSLLLYGNKLSPSATLVNKCLELITPTDVAAIKLEAPPDINCKNTICEAPPNMMMDIP